MAQIASNPKSLNWIMTYAIGSSILSLILFVVLIAAGRSRASDTSRRVPEENFAPQSQGAISSTVSGGKSVVDQHSAALAKADANRRSALMRVQGLERHVATLRQSLSAAETEKSRYATRVKAYAMDHKAAIAAMGIAVGGISSAADRKNNLNDDQKTVAAVLGVGAGLYALANGEECMEVADQMAKAAVIQADHDRRIKELQRQMSKSLMLIDKERAAIR